MKKGFITYSKAGVDIDEGARLVNLIKPLARSTSRPEVIAGVGGFGALFSGRFGKFKNPVLVSSTDGVGTKLRLAFMADEHRTIGIDLVAMSVNDLLTSGAEPLFFLDYFATGKLNAKKASDVIRGIAKGCSQAGCALVGGETAEMPGFYKEGEYDIAGFAVGVVERKGIIDGTKIRPGDAVIGMSSSGLHSNGYSLARKVLFDCMGMKLSSSPRGLTGDLKTALLKPTRIYVKPVLKVLKKYEVLGMAHITGGGFTDNIPRVLPAGVKAVIERGSWPVQGIFRLIQKHGPVEEDEMLRTFNCGIGMALIVRDKDARPVIKALKAMRIPSYRIGAIMKRKAKEAQVEFAGKAVF
ncbi:MAG: phosphoribosylformylglycinamidine cyclo-ligase [Deltaproteobacteria bacterium]|nr:phosphoribosylformylglycinamidine cyclo-ligase [Deltaproteobacteria bacterium]